MNNFELNKLFYLHSNCHITIGSCRSIIIDTQRNDFAFIPNDLAINLLGYNAGNINELISSFNIDDKETVLEYLNYLINEEYIFVSNLKVDIDYLIKPSHIVSENLYVSIIDIMDGFDNVSNFLSKIKNVNVYIVQLRFLNEVDLEGLKKNLELFENTDVRNIQVIAKVDDIAVDNIDELCTKNPRLQFVNMLGCKDIQGDENINCSGCSVIKSKRKVVSEKSCGLIDSAFFVKNFDSYTLSLNHNSCLYKKISIDKEGNIKNCPSMAESFGNIKDTTLEEALSHTNFKKYWNITKDQIDVCKDCEFRHICTDCRAYTENPEDQYSKPLKCGYNPYTNAWEEWSTNPLKQKAIQHYGMQELVIKENV
jgi:SPASM domain peptide maturase of grasp-with-spasm system